MWGSCQAIARASQRIDPPVPPTNATSGTAKPASFFTTPLLLLRTERNRALKQRVQTADDGNLLHLVGDLFQRLEFLKPH
jgi:hypothetical protein